MKKLLILPLIALSSCASIIEGSKQTISVKTSPDKPSNCKAFKGDFMQEFKSPASIEIPKSYYPLTITCSPEEGKEGTVKILSDVANWGYGGAVLGVGVGAVYDSYTGAAFEYPSEVIVKLGETITVGETGMNNNVEAK